MQRTYQGVKKSRLITASKGITTAMAINNDRRSNKTMSECYDGPLVISGISGRFPNASNMKELTTKLFEGQELTSKTEMRWRDKNLPTRFGFLNCLDKFDAGFFGITPYQCDQIDPQIRLLLEVTVEAIIDAGINPAAIRGSRTAVFSGAYGGEVMMNFQMRPNLDATAFQYSSHGFMIPARLAFHLDLHGISLHVASGCSSSMAALNHAVQSIKSGQSDAAIVTGSTLHLNPMAHKNLLELNALAMDGRCKTFDGSGDGFCRSEAAVAVLIQKEGDALRNYAQILSVRSNTDGFKIAGIMHPKTESQEELLRQCYAEAGIDTTQVSYVEAHGTGTPSGDPEELLAIHNVFCKPEGRERPLLVGSVKTNIGHTEGAAGLCGLSKVIAAIQTGLIPPNLHFLQPAKELAHLMDGSIKVVTETTKYDRGIVGVSSFGIGGTNYHMVLQPGPVQSMEPNQDLPVLLPLSGRSEVQVQQSLEEASEAAANPEFVHLLHMVYHQHIPGHSYRGVALVQPNKSGGDITVKLCETGNRPVWIVFPGMGSQHNEMGQHLMKIETFAESIRKSRGTLLNIGLDIDQLLSAGNTSIFTDIRHAFIAITTVQVALWDTLSCLGLQPQGFLGHSFGEFLCAYADGCLTADETLLLADARGKAFKESKRVIGGMASIGLPAEDIESHLPPNIELACFNSAQNVTVSGEYENVANFVKKMKNQGTMAAMVQSCGFAAHCRHVQNAGEVFKKYMVDIVVNNQPRSDRWISTSFPKSEWNTPLAKSCSAEYFENNIINPVYFHQAVQHVPSGSLVVEVSPNGFFKALLSETIPNDCIYIGPMALKAENKLDHYFSSIGEMYLSGVDVKMDKLYPPVRTPVSSHTPSLSHLVQWDHSKSWKTNILDYPMGYKYQSIINLDTANHRYLTGHKIEDRIVLPAAHMLHFVWIQFAEMLGMSYETLPVLFTDVSFKRATILKTKSETEMMYSVNISTGAFEVENQGEIVASGKIENLPEDYQWPKVPTVVSSTYLPLNKEDVYKVFRLRGYNYSGLFQGIEKIDNEGRWADVHWRGNWTAFIDAVLQTTILTTVSNHLVLPVDIQEIKIDPFELKKHLENTRDMIDQLVRVVNLPSLNTTLTRGVEVKSINTMTVPRKLDTSNLAYEKFTFCPLMEASRQSSGYHFQELVDLVLENHPFSLPLRVLDIFTKKENSQATSFAKVESLKPSKRSHMRLLTLSCEAERMDVKIVSGHPLESKEKKEELVPDNTVDLVLLDDPSLLPGIGVRLNPKSFVMVHSTQVDFQSPETFSLISQKKLQGRTMTLLRKKYDAAQDIAHISVDEDGFNWLNKLQEAISKNMNGQMGCRIYVTSQGRPFSGILGLMRCMITEDDGWNIRCIFDPQGKLSLDFQRPDSRLESILENDLLLNVWQDDQLGTYRHIPLDDDALARKAEVQDAYVGTLIPGDLTKLSWIELPPMNWLSDGEGQHQSHRACCRSRYKVVCSALNFRDVLLATGTIPLQPDYSYNGQYLGFEFSGFDENEKRVMGITNGNGLASFVHADPKLIWSIPNHWSFQEAATVPIVYTTVLYAFYRRGNIQAGQRVLVHAGSGGVGQAAIRIALAEGCEVFTTVGSEEKRQFLKMKFSQLTDEHIGCSRDTSFERQFLEGTNGHGFDVILNSLAGEKLQASLRCLAVGGTFLEIGVFDAYMNTKIGMRPFLKSVEIVGIDLRHIMGYKQESNEIKILRELMEEGIINGTVSPLPAHSFTKYEIEDAFRFMANGRHKGKLVIDMKENKTSNEPLNISAVKRSYFHPRKLYLVVGGLGGLGLQLVSWLIERGARRIVISSRSGITRGYQSYCMRKWQKAGADVQVVKIDLCDEQPAESFILDLLKDSELGGVFNAALVLQDKPFFKQTVESFLEVSRPKVAISLNLDKISRKHRLRLDYFVCFSSVTCGRGNFDQTNYGWSNSAVERICESRVKDGLPGLAIQYGVIGKVGFLSDMMNGTEFDGNFELMGLKSQSVESCLHVLDASMQQYIPVVSSLVVAPKEGTNEETTGIILQVEKIFGIDSLKSIAEDKKLSELGMDSIIAIEMRQILERESKITVTKDNLRRLTVGNIIAISEGTFDVKTIGKAIDTKEESEVHLLWKIHDKPLLKLQTHESDKHVFIVHGSDGGCDHFTPLASRLRANVYAFQFTGKPEGATVPEFANFYIEKIKEIQPDGPYTLMGYSLGAAIAFNMALWLTEKNNLVKDLVFLDGFPSYTGIPISAKRWLMLLTLQSLNTAPEFSEDELRALADNLNGDVENDVKQIFNVIKFPNELKLVESQAKMYAHLLNSIAMYEPKRKYEGNVVLLEAIEHSAHTQVIPSEDYDVSKFCCGNITRHRVKGSHWTFFDEDNVLDKANILNRLLEKC